MESAPRYTAGGVLLFPISYSTGISRHLSLSVLIAVISLSCWTAFQNTSAVDQTASSTPISWVEQNESRLQAKANQVVGRFTDQEFSVDISVVMDHSRIETSSYVPGDVPKILTAQQEMTDQYKEQAKSRHDQDSKKKQESMSKHKRSQNWELTGTWQDSVNEHPRISRIQCCVSISKDQDLNEDHLFRCLSTSLGIDLSRGDVLRIVAI